jgi:hypothetical protein
MEPVAHRAARRALTLALLCAAAWPAGAQNSLTMNELQRSGDLICELRASGPYPRRARNADVLLIYDRVATRAGSARMVSSRRVGSYPVKVYAGETGLHLVQDLSGSVVVTTLTGCEARARSGRCQRYTSVNAWHFDRSVHRNADRAYRRLPGTSYSGTCEAWHMDDPVRAGLFPSLYLP